jgi:hypothetical protein
MKKENTYRALDRGRLPMAAEQGPSNAKSRDAWRNRMCCCCFQRGTVLVKGELYCKDHAPTEGVN